MTHLKSWWYKESGFTNFGDELGHLILEELGHEVEYVPFREADILTTGSILQYHNVEPLKPGTIIWGTGWHRTEITRPLPELDIRALRGKITGEHLRTRGVGHGGAWGDPGLLASHLWPARKKEYALGFVRHYIDNRPTPPGAFEIRATDDPKEVCLQISSCDAIVSSSLHGCIVAASYGIPFMRLYDRNVVGGDTKWIDFTTSLDLPITTIQQHLLWSIDDL